MIIIRKFKIGNRSMQFFFIKYVVYHNKNENIYSNCLKTIQVDHDLYRKYWMYLIHSYLLHDILSMRKERLYIASNKRSFPIAIQ